MSPAGKLLVLIFLGEVAMAGGTELRGAAHLLTTSSELMSGFRSLMMACAARYQLVIRRLTCLPCLCLPDLAGLSLIVVVYGIEWDGVREARLRSPCPRRALEEWPSGRMFVDIACF